MAMTYDKMVLDSTGAFLLNELERMDNTLHSPLASITYTRDIKLRTDISMGDEVSSWNVSNFASPSGAGNASGVSWISKEANAIPAVNLDLGIFRNPVPLVGYELKYTIPELQSAMQLGRPVDSQKLEGIKLKHGLDLDRVVYLGEPAYGSFGLTNQAISYLTNQANVTGGTWNSLIGPTAVTPNPGAVLAQVNEILQSAWQTSAWAVLPNKLGLPPYQFALLNATIVSTAGNKSLLTFIEENNISRAHGIDLKIVPMKYLAIAQSGRTFDRMVAYNDALNFVRYPMVPLERTPLQYESIYQKTVYFGRIGAGVEFVYPETGAYRDGI